MYETIEEADDGQEPPKDAPPRRRRAAFAMLVCFGLLGAAALYAGRGEPSGQIDQDAMAAELTAYRAALTDPSAALRRARLTDFLKAHPQSPRITAVKAQLQVIAQAEARDWSALSHIIFDTQQDAETKLAALDRYEAIWDTSLLGGRASDVNGFRESLSGEDQISTDRNLPVEADPANEGARGDALAGGFEPRPKIYVPPPRHIIERPAPKKVDVVEPPRIRKNRKPKYPRRALERGAGAVVTLELYIDAEGRVDMTELISVKADAYEKQFIRAAERAALRTRYHPQTVNGIPVAVQGIEKTYRFRLRN